MQKKNQINGYNSFSEFENEIYSITDLSKLEEQNKLFAIVYKITGLYIESKYGYYLTGDLYTKMLNSIKEHLFQTKNIESLFYVNNLYARECLKILNGNFELDFRNYFYRYEDEHNVEMVRTNIGQIILLRKSIGTLENHLFEESGTNESSFSSVEEIEETLNLLIDLSNENQRYVLRVIMYKIMRLYGYKLILSPDVFEAINCIISKFVNNVINREYYSDKNKSYMDKIITSLLDSYPQTYSSTIDLYYHIGIEKVENELSLKAKHLTLDELQSLENSGINYMKNRCQYSENKTYIKNK